MQSPSRREMRRRECRLGRRLLILGVAGLAMLYVASLVPPLQRALYAMEFTVFRLINRSLAENATLDWTILVAASRFWYYASIGIVVGVAVAEIWKLRRGDYGQLLGYLLLILLATVVVKQVADFIADTIQRELPWDLGDFHLLIQKYDVEFLSIPQRGGILDDNTASWLCLALLLAPRLPRAARFAFGLLLAHVLARITIGSQWMTDEVTSALLAATAAGLVLRTAGWPLAWMERRLSRLFIAAFWRSFDPADRTRSGAGARHDRLISRHIRGLIRRTFYRDGVWHHLARSHVAPLLGCDPDRYELRTTPPPPFDDQPFRVSPEVRFLRVETGEWFVLRMWRRRGGILHETPKSRRFADSFRANLYLERLGLPVPRLYWVREGFATAGLRTMHVAVQEYLPGRSLDPDAPEQLTSAMETLARMHAHTSPGWGRIVAGTTHPRALFTLELLREEYLHYSRRLGRRLGQAAGEPFPEEAWQALAEAAARALSVPSTPFRLTHGDINIFNFLRHADSRIFLIDFVTVRHDLPGAEIIRAAIALPRSRAELTPKLWQAYFEAAGEARWSEFRRQGGLALARCVLREFAHGRGLPREGDPRRSPESIAAHLAGLARADDTLWGDEPARTDWPRLLAMIDLGS